MRHGCLFLVTFGWLDIRYPIEQTLTTTHGPQCLTQNKAPVTEGDRPILGAWPKWIQNAKPDHWPMRSQQAKAWGSSWGSGRA